MIFFSTVDNGEVCKTSFRFTQVLLRFLNPIDNGDKYNDDNGAIGAPLSPLVINNSDSLAMFMVDNGEVYKTSGILILLQNFELGRRQYFNHYA